MIFLSEALSVEYESKGIIIQTVLPSTVKTKLLNDSLETPFAVTPQEYVSSAIKTVGIETLTYGHWKHKLLAYFTNITATALGPRIYMKLVFNILKIIRNDNYKKLNLIDDMK